MKRSNYLSVAIGGQSHNTLWQSLGKIMRDTTISRHQMGRTEKRFGTPSPSQ